MEIASGLIGAVTAAVIAALISFLNSQSTALHNESTWRGRLYDLASVTSVGLEQLYGLRTCVSPTRGTTVHYPKRNRFDPTWRNDPNMDDLIINFVHVMIANINKSNKKTLTPQESEVFRQLCRLLLKGDWSFRKNKSDPSGYFHSADESDEQLKKAMLIVYRLFGANSYELEEILLPWREMDVIKSLEAVDKRSRNSFYGKIILGKDNDRKDLERDKELNVWKHMGTGNEKTTKIKEIRRIVKFSIKFLTLLIFISIFLSAIASFLVLSETFYSYIYAGQFILEVILVLLVVRLIWLLLFR
ncbi:hypothetical protein LROSL1_1209 [Furfurilactobacillus rossiae]|uniref:hypothetical protein n=1 Tax=Furfurilactobacillus rossiae TaxID=231049 RepID=UPI0015B8E6BD|nr:hypothetical protein [Furfurilactobacillus rossiae]QLE64026.1 hypothetical protein LROSL1_1209 [Furfurilactobacillus rossiae]